MADKQAQYVDAPGTAGGARAVTAGLPDDVEFAALGAGRPLAVTGFARRGNRVYVLVEADDDALGRLAKESWASQRDDHVTT